MKLTDKANDDFLDWITDKYFFKGKTFLDLTIYQKGDVGQFLRYPTTKNAYIIEWFDSVGFHVHIEPHIGGGADVYYPTIIWRDENFIDRYESIDNNDYFNSRPEATKAAIEKANEIYNSQHFAQ